MKLFQRAALVPFALLVLTLAFASCRSDDTMSTTTASSMPMSPGVSEPMSSGTGMGPIQDATTQTSDNEFSLPYQKAQARVRQLLAQAESAANAGRHEQARDLYREALDTDPSNPVAEAGYRRMLTILAGGKGAQQDTNAFGHQVAAEQARLAKAQSHFQEGLRARSEGRLDDAVVELTKSYQLLKFGPQRPGTLTADRVRQVLDDTKMAKERDDRIRTQSEEEELARMQAEEENRERKKVERRVQALWDNALTQFEAERYERAERIADEILRLNFRDENARQLKELSRRARLAIAEERNVTDYRNEWEDTIERIKQATVLPSSEIGFPNSDKWRQISDRGAIELSRGAISEESEADRAVRSKLAQTILPKVDWAGKTLPEVVDELRAQANINIAVTPEAATTAEDAGELGLEFTQITAGYALDAAAAQLGVAYSVSDGIVKIQTVEESRKNKVVEIYNIADLISPINSFPGVQLNLNASGVGGEEEEDDGGDDEANLAIDPDRLQDLIKRAVDPAWDDDGENKIEAKQGTGTLIVRQTPEKQRLVRRLLDDLRKNTGVQVSIEARFITVENNFLQEIGVDLRGLGDDTGGVGVPGPGTNRPLDDFGITGTGVGTSTAPAGVGTDAGSGFFFSDRNGDTDVRGRVENLFDELLGDPTVLDNTGGLSFQFAFLDDTQLEAILRAVQKYERINTLIAPKVLVYNTQRAHLTVLNEIAYVKDFDVEIAQAAVIADPIVDKVREGVVLDVRPIVSHDRRYVTLVLRPTVATLVRPIRTFTTSLAVGAAVTFQLPELRKETVNTTVMVPDGGTLLLAGMKFAEEQTLESGVPILADIPILSFFFSRKGKSTNLRDVIILLKVKIVVLEELEPGVGDDLLR